MKGNNTMTFNEATMMEIVQLYLNKIMTEPPTVRAVRETETHPTRLFKVEVESEEKL